MRPVRVMVVCGKNACRSQMAEGLLRALGEGRVEPSSAGIEAGGLDPRATRAMAEIDIDISDHTSDTIDPQLLREMDWVITVCAEADAACPIIPPGVGRLRWPVPDPAAVPGDGPDAMAEFRRVRDQLKALVVGWLESGEYRR